MRSICKEPKTRKGLSAAILLLVLILPVLSFGQNYPVQVNLTLIPPYTLNLSDYTEAGSNRILATILLRNLDKPTYQVKLKLTIAGNGFTLVTSDNYIAPPLTLQGGIPETFTGNDLANYFDPSHLDFNGTSKQDYLRTKKLPEGYYQFSIEVYDYLRGNLVSNKATVNAYIVLNTPPLINRPANSSKLAATDPQNVVFNWAPQHLGSPNSAFSTEYDLKLVEIWPNGRAPYEAMQSTPALYEATTLATSLVYDVMCPFLTPGKEYAFNVRAKDVNGLDLFKNDGYSETYMFTFGDECKPPTSITAKGVNGPGLEMDWTSGVGQTAYNINYRLKGGATWYSSQSLTTSASIYQLPANTDIEYQINSVCGTVESTYSDIYTGRTPAEDTASFKCGGDASLPAITNFNPMFKLTVGSVITAGGYTATITSVSGGSGVFTGECLVEFPFFRRAKVAHTFKDIKVNELGQLYEGKLVSKYNPNSAFLTKINTSTETTASTDGKADNTYTVTGDTVKYNTGISSIEEGDDGEVLVIDTNGDTTYIEHTDEGTLVISPTGDTTTLAADEPVTVVGSDGSKTVIGSDGSIASVTSEASQMTIDKNDVNLYIYQISNEILYDEDKDKTKNSKNTDRYYKNGETMTLPLGNQNFHVEQKYVKIDQIIDGNPSGNAKIVAKGDINKPNFLSSPATCDNINLLKDYCAWTLTGVSNQTANGESFSVSFNQIGAYTLKVTQNTNLTATLCENNDPHVSNVYKIFAPENACEINLNIVESPPVSFETGVSYNGEYGFDPLLCKTTKNNETPIKIGDIDYYIPWMSLQKGQEQEIVAKIDMSKTKGNPKDFTYRFECNDNTAVSINGATSYDLPGNNLKVGLNTLTFKIKANTEISPPNYYELYVTEVNSNTKVGQINIFCENTEPYVPNKFKLIKVTTGTTNQFDVAVLEPNVENYLNNNSYNQAFIKWNGVVGNTLDISFDLIKEYLNPKGEIFNNQSSYTGFMQKIEQYYYSLGLYNLDEKTVFVADRSVETVNGKTLGGYGDVGTGNLAAHYSMIFYSAINDYTTYAHELGHNLGLVHVEDYGENQGSTSNIMDYSTLRNMFWKLQWDIINNYSPKKQQQ
jgi:hypothetical protein